MKLLKVIEELQQGNFNSLNLSSIDLSNEDLQTFFNEYGAFPPTLLNLLICHNYEALVMQWSNQWSIASFKYQDELGNTPLHNAIILEKESLIVWLLTHEAPLDLKNKANQSPFTLLKEAKDLNLTGEAYYILANHYFSQGNNSGEQLLHHYQRALNANYNPTNWMVALIELLGDKGNLESVSIRKIADFNPSLPQLNNKEKQTLIRSITTSEGRLIPALTQQGYTPYHLVAFLGSEAWFDILKILETPSESSLNITSKLILNEDYQGLSPSALAKQQMHAIAKVKGIKLDSSEAEQNPIVQRYRICAMNLRQYEENIQLNSFSVIQQRQQLLRISYKDKIRALKQNIATLVWEPKTISEEHLAIYSKILHQVWSAKQSLITLEARLKDGLSWPKGFNPADIQSPPQTIQALKKTASFILKLQVTFQGTIGDEYIVYIDHYRSRLSDWLAKYNHSSNAEQISPDDCQVIQQGFNQLTKAYETYGALWKNTPHGHQHLLNAHTLLLRKGDDPVFITPLLKGGDTLSPAAKLSYSLAKKERIEKMTGTRKRPVFLVNDVNYKRNPHAPGIAFMVNSLNSLLTGQSGTPIELVKVISPEGSAYIYEACYDVQAKNLESLLTYHPEYIHKLNLKDFSAMVVLGILTDFQNGKPDSYKIEFSQNDSGEIREVNILSIYNDLAFSDVMISQHVEGEKAGQNIMNIKNVLYFFPQMIKPIAADFREMLLNTQPEFILVEWLQLLVAKNKEYASLLTEEIFTREEYEGSFFTNDRGLQLPFKLAPRTIVRVYHKLRQIHGILTQRSSVTLWELLTAVEPEVAAHYAQIKQTYPHEILGCDVMQCIKVLYEENITHASDLSHFQSPLEADYGDKMTNLILKTIDHFGLENNRTASLKNNVVDMLKYLNYGSFKGALAPQLYKILNELTQALELGDLLKTALSHDCGHCTYWLWEEKLIEQAFIQTQCEDIKHFTLLHFFAQTKQLKGIEALLSKGIYRINVSNNSGYTPLHVAASTGNFAIVKYLVEHGAHVETTISQTERTALMMAKERCAKMNKAVSGSGDKKYGDLIDYLNQAVTVDPRQINIHRIFSSKEHENQLNLSSSIKVEQASLDSLRLAKNKKTVVRKIFSSPGSHPWFFDPDDFTVDKHQQRLGGSAVDSQIFIDKKAGHRWVVKCNLYAIDNITYSDKPRYQEEYLEILGYKLYELLGIPIPERVGLSAVPINKKLHEFLTKETNVVVGKNESILHVFSQFKPDFKELGLNFLADYARQKSMGRQRYVIRNNKSDYPLYGLGAVMAAALFLHDIDWLGNSGGNVGWVPDKDANGNPIACIFKIDPGAIFTFLTGSAFHTADDKDNPFSLTGHDAASRLTWTGTVADKLSFQKLMPADQYNFVEMVHKIAQLTENQLREIAKPVIATESLNETLFEELISGLLKRQRRFIAGLAPELLQAHHLQCKWRRWENNDEMRQSTASLLSLKDSGAIAQIYHQELQGKPLDAGQDGAWLHQLPSSPACFIGRENLLNCLTENFHQQQSEPGWISQSIVGLGGVGKSQVAIQFAYKYQEIYHKLMQPLAKESPAIAEYITANQRIYQRIIWVYAETPEILEDQYRMLGNLLLNEVDSNYPLDQLIYELYQLLNEEFTLLIWDGGENPNALTRFYPPRDISIHWLITSREEGWPVNTCHRLEGFTPIEGMMYIQKHLLHAKSLKENEQLLQTVHYHPLALAQAVAYIGEGKSTLANYPRVFLCHQLQIKDRCLDESSALETLSPSLQLNLVFLSQQNPSVLSILQGVIGFEPRYIPIKYLGKVVQQEQETLVTSLYLLQRYHLVNYNPYTQIVTINHLFQQILDAQWENEQDRLEHWQKVAKVINNALRVTGESAPFGEGKSFAIHARYCLQAYPEAANDLVKAKLQETLGCYYQDKIKLYEQARELFESALAIIKKYADKDGEKMRVTSHLTKNTHFLRTINSPSSARASHSRLFPSVSTPRIARRDKETELNSLTRSYN